MVNKALLRAAHFTTINPQHRICSAFICLSLVKPHRRSRKMISIAPISAISFRFLWAQMQPDDQPKQPVAPMRKPTITHLFTISTYDDNDIRNLYVEPETCERIWQETWNDIRSTKLRCGAAYGGRRRKFCFQQRGSARPDVNATIDTRW
jgi:hypothetical protein